MFYNYKGEKLIYINHHDGKGDLNIFLAGVTTPNPNYKSMHNITVNSEFDKYQLEYVFAGKGYIEAGSKKYTVCAGDFFFLNKLKPHIYYSDRHDLLEKIFITINGTLMDSFVEAFSMTDSVIIRHVNVYDQLVRIHNILEKTTIETHNSDMDKIALIILEIMQKVRKLPKTTVQFSDEADHIRNYIENNLDNVLTLDSIAKYFFKSKTHIIRLFKSKYHCTPIQYAVRRKIESAKHILSYTDLSIESISDMLAFSSSKHFAQTFKKITGTSPRNFRKTAKR